MAVSAAASDTDVRVIVMTSLAPGETSGWRRRGKDMRRSSAALSVLAVLALSVAACGGDDDGTAAAPSATASGAVCQGANAAGGLLAQVCSQGKIRVSTDPAYPPQSSLNEKTGKYEGFDIDTASEIAHRLGVGISWETPSWDVPTAGSWNGRWDMSVGSMTPTNDRQKVLDFTEPYYYTPAVVV